MHVVPGVGVSVGVSVGVVSEQVGQLQVPLLLVVGEDDQNWPAQESALDVSSRPEGQALHH